MLRREDELGHITLHKLHEASGLKLSEAVYKDIVALEADNPFALTEYAYDDPLYPGFATRKVVRKTSAYEKPPSWEVDLVHTYESDAAGNVVRMVADPGPNEFTWVSRYNEHNHLISKRYPNGYFIEFRYNTHNELDRVYRSHGEVKKMVYDGAGNTIKKTEPDGVVTASGYDAFRRLIREEVQTGPMGERKKTVRVIRRNAAGFRIYESAPGKPAQYNGYEGLQRLAFRREGRGLHITFYGYSANGNSRLFRSGKVNCIRVVSGVLLRWHYTYDAMQNCLRQSSGLLRVWAFRPWARPRFAYGYDVAGNCLWKRDGDRLTSYEYDPLNRVTVTRGPHGAWTAVLRTSTGLEYGSLDHNNKRVEKKFNPAGEEVS